ncbi:hypothetical protein AB0D74_49615 [Streptomyces sp. NPDC048278]
MVANDGAPPRKGWMREAAERLGVALAARAVWTLIERLLHH